MADAILSGCGPGAYVLDCNPFAPVNPITVVSRVNILCYAVVFFWFRMFEAVPVARGLTYKEAGARLYISERTVKYHMGEIVERLQLANKHQESTTTRRSFLKTAAASTLLMASGSTGLISGCDRDKPFVVSAYSKILLHDFRLFDGIQGQLSNNLVIPIAGDRIEGIEQAGSLEQYRDYHRIDLKGMTLLPGLIDNHVHITVPFMYNVNLQAAWQMNEQVGRNFKNCILNGVTTVRDVGGFPGKINRFREMCDRGEIPGPRVVSSLSPIAARDGNLLGAPEAAEQMSSRLTAFLENENRTLEGEAYENLQGHPVYERKMFPNVLANLRKLYDSGAKIGVGTDIRAMDRLRFVMKGGVVYPV